MGIFDCFKKKEKSKTEERAQDALVAYLKERIEDNASLESLVDAFEDMCRIPMEDDMILFETGTFSFTGKPLFQFSLARQFPNEEEEYYQLHMDVLYNPTPQNEQFKGATWNEDIDGNFFEYIRNSDIYNRLKDEMYIEIDVYMDET